MRCLFFASAMLLVAPIAARAGDQDFRLQNKTGYQIDKVFVSAMNTKSWGDDIMGRDALADGEGVDIVFHNSTTDCRWDVKVQYNDGDTASWTNLNLCDVSKVTLFWNRKSQETTATVE